MLAQLWLLVAATCGEAAEDTCFTTKEPARGQFGTKVTIQGTDLLGGFGGTDIIEVTLAGVEAKIDAGNDTHLVVVVQDGAGDGDIVVTSNTGAQAVRESGWSYSALGSVDTASPSNGHGGTFVTISGSRLLGGGKKATSVKLAGIEVAKIVKSSEKEIVIQASPSAAAVTDKITIVSDTGAIVESKNDTWTYNKPAQITEVKPDAGQVGTKVTISGTALRGYGASVATVFLGTVQADINSQTDTKIIVTVRDANAAKNAAVTLTANTGAVVSKAGAWEYLARGQVSKLEPAQGQTGTRVAVLGTGLRGGGPKVASVVLVGKAATITNETDTRVDIIVPAGYAHHHWPATARLCRRTCNPHFLLH